MLPDLVIWKSKSCYADSFDMKGGERYESILLMSVSTLVGIFTSSASHVEPFHVQADGPGLLDVFQQTSPALSLEPDGGVSTA